MALWRDRSIRPAEPLEPNENPAGVAPASVGPPDAVPGDPSGVELEAGTTAAPPPPPSASPWSGWPAGWAVPGWGRAQVLADTAWACIDLNARTLATMPPYLVSAPPSLDAGWLGNPQPEIYTSWAEFAKQLFWDYMLGEAFVLATARYTTGWPARFHVVPPWSVNVEMGAGERRYTIGRLDVTGDLLHLRYQSSVGDAHGHGPLEAGSTRVIAAEVLTRYATGLAAGGGIPASVLEHPDLLEPEQATALKNQWVAARLSAIGEPAVLSGGVTWQPTQVNPKDMALIELAQHNESRIAVLLGVPPFLVGLPSGGDSMTYQNVQSVFDFHWRAGLRPSAEAVMAGLSGWALPRGVAVEVNSDAYVRPDPAQRASIYQTLSAIQDASGPAITVDEIRRAERLDGSTTAPDELGVLK